MKPTIEILISPAGEITIDAIGFKGADCQAATQFLEEALGVATNKVRKPEFQARARTSTQQKVGS